ncbi:MAG: hypothetical protein Q7R69_02300 [bacterium]|nr:hypothetical protein [bacterium]
MGKYNDVTAGQTEACINRMGGWDNFLRFIGGQGKVAFETILAMVRMVKVIAQPAITTSKKYFEEAGVRWMGENFESQFLGLRVEATEAGELKVHRLTEDALDAPILAELGDKAEISASRFKAFLADNRRSTEWFVFYLRGRDGNLCPVDAGWSADDGGWLVNAYSVEDPSGWSSGRQVVSSS